MTTTHSTGASKKPGGLYIPSVKGIVHTKMSSVIIYPHLPCHNLVSLLNTKEYILKTKLDPTDLYRMWTIHF